MDLKYDRTVCWECGGKRVELTDTDPDGVIYKYWKCTKCGEKTIDMKQLREVVLEERKIKKSKLAMWGTALAMRIPKEVVQKQKLKPGFKVRIIPEKIGFKVIPEKE